MLQTSTFDVALAERKVQSPILFPLHTVTHWALVLQAAQIWTIRSCVSCCLSAMILLTAFDVNLTAGVEFIAIQQTF
jgi:hypothetical protein